MDNKKKKHIRRGMSAVGFFLFAFSIFTFGGLELPFYNHYNPLYNPYPWIVMGFLLFVGRTFIRDKKGVGNFIDFFDRSGLVIGSYEIPFENIKPTHANYIDKEGEKKSIRHTHPFAIPSEDMWTNEFLVPSSGLEALNPTHLIKKYSAKLKDFSLSILVKSVGNFVKLSFDEIKEILINLEPHIEEIAALDPQVLHIQESESDNVDGMNQEAAFQTAEVRKGWFSGTKTGQMLLYVAVGIMVGVMACTFVYMAGHVDFSHLNGVIR